MNAPLHDLYLPAKKFTRPSRRGRMLKSPVDFVRIWDEIQTLRRDLHVEDDVLVNPIHFLTATDDTRRSASVACWRSGKLIGILYATEHFVAGVGTGYAISGDFVGRGSLLCRPEDESDVLPCAVRTMLASGIHSLHLRMIPHGGFKLSLKGLRLRNLESLIPGDRLPLLPAFDDFLTTLGKHTRRNVRYYTRKAEAAGIQFVPCLSQAEYDEAVTRLNAETTFPAEPLRLARDERLMELHEGCERFGLRAPDGTLIAVLSGFPQGQRFHILTQLNDVHFEHLSLSLVLRGATIQHLIRNGCTSLQFMGGTSLSFGRFCIPHQYRSVFIDRSRGTAATAKRLARRWILRQERIGKYVTDSVKALANGFLPEPSLIARTAIAPAAVAFAHLPPKENAC